MENKAVLDLLEIAPEYRDVLENCKSLTIAHDVDDLIKLSVPSDNPRWEVGFDVPGIGYVPGMFAVLRMALPQIIRMNLRRDPDSMITDDLHPTKFGSKKYLMRTLPNYDNR